MIQRTAKHLFNLFWIVLLLTACSNKPLNNPYPSKDSQSNIYYASFSEQPKTLDPARSYSANEAVFTAEIYEPPLQYHYLKRPYTLIPLTVTSMPAPAYYDSKGKQLPDNAAVDQIAYTIYEIHIKSGIFYQPHPAFAKDKKGQFYYHNLTYRDLKHIHQLTDFKYTDTRELTADDYVYEIKRLASPKLQSPILGLMSDYIIGLKQLNDDLQKKYDELMPTQGEQFYLDLRDIKFAGAQVIDRYSYRVKIKGKYPQFLYWLAMPFFAPVPWEVDYFYSQPGMFDKNLTLDWFPVGTGPYMLTENNPNKEIVLERNPKFHGETYPTEGEAGDQAKGLLQDAGKALPFVDKFIFTLETESIPRWSKFLQGYYDSSGISSDSFDQTITIDKQGNPQLTDEMQSKGIKLQTTVATNIFYMGFNMLDDLVGGYTEKARKLRQAISIAIDDDDYIAIFLNGRGIAAQGPLPPHIFGYLDGKEGINPYVYHWANNKPERLTIDVAKKLLVEAGYPNGRDPKTDEALVLKFDAITSSGPDDKSYYDWMRKQFNKLGIELHVEGTTYNRFQEKVRTGNVQLFSWGWSADYPDPENFLFLLYSQNGKVKFGGENAANYNNPQYDKLFNEMKSMFNSPERQTDIDQMLELVRKDAPWVFGFYPMDFSLSHQWVSPAKISDVANNTLKYIRIDPILRAKMRAEWNHPKWWPIQIIIGFLLLIMLPVAIKFWQKEYRAKERK